MSLLGLIDFLTLKKAIKPNEPLRENFFLVQMSSNIGVISSYRVLIDNFRMTTDCLNTIRQVSTMEAVNLQTILHSNSTNYSMNIA